MTIVHKMTVSATATGSSAATTVVTTAAIAVGDLVVFMHGRAASAATVNGVASVATSAGALGTLVRNGNGCRTVSTDVAIAAALCTTAIASGSTLTMTARSTAAKRGIVVSVFSDISTATHEATSGTAADSGAGDVSAGPNGGSATTANFSTTGSTTTADSLVINAVGVPGTVTGTPGAGFTLLAEARTTTGSGDRGVMASYRINTATSVQNATNDFAAAQTWSGAVAAFPGATPTGGGTGLGKVVVSGAKKTVVSESVVIAGAKKAVVHMWVIQGGAKKPIP